ncbi:MAG: hypothetical protein WD894_02735 [Pirellulales bacterium]
MLTLSFKLRSMLLGVAVFGIVCATVFSGSVWWARVLDVLVWGALVGVIIAASVGHGGTRYFSLGFAIAAGLYVPMAFSGTLLQRLPGPHVLADELAKWIQEGMALTHAKRVVEPGFEAKYENEGMIRVGPRSVYFIWQSGDWERTQRSVHCATTLLLGCLGGALALRFRAIDEKAEGATFYRAARRK